MSDEPKKGPDTPADPPVNRGRAGMGRPPGSPNKTTKAVKEMILEALDNAGGAEYLQKQAEKNPGAFMQLIGKVLPMQVTGPGDGPVQQRILVELVKPEEKP